MKLAFKLTGLSTMPPDERTAAEERFGYLLAEVFGGEDGVWRRYQAFRAALSSGQHESAGPGEARRDVARWKDAATVAARLALGSHANDPAAAFEIAPVNDIR